MGKFHEQKLLRKVNFVNWEDSNNLHEVKIMKRYCVQKREDYTMYNKLSREIREIVRRIKELDPRSQHRTDMSAQFLTKLYAIGVIPTKWNLENADKVNVRSATQMVEQGHVRVGTDVIKDPAFLVSRNME